MFLLGLLMISFLKGYIKHTEKQLMKTDKGVSHYSEQLFWGSMVFLKQHTVFENSMANNCIPTCWMINWLRDFRFLSKSKAAFFKIHKARRDMQIKTNIWYVSFLLPGTFSTNKAKRNLEMNAPKNLLVASSSPATITGLTALMPLSGTNHPKTPSLWWMAQKPLLSITTGATTVLEMIISEQGR